MLEGGGRRQPPFIAGRAALLRDRIGSRAGSCCGSAPQTLVKSPVLEIWWLQRMSTLSRRAALREISRLCGSSNNQQNITSSASPSPPSPDEEVIRLRGRRKLSQQTPTVGMTPPKTPTKSPRKARSPGKSNTNLRTPLTPTRFSPRKRLELSSAETSDEVHVSPSKRGNVQAKRTRLNLCPDWRPSDLEAAVGVLSHGQLMDVVRGILKDFPEAKKSVIERFPQPDLQPLENRLLYLKRNVYRSFPRCRLTSNGDSFCYRRVETHLEAFKKECLDQCRQIANTQQWGPTLNFVLMAWDYVRMLPDWDDPSHNRIKGQCFRSLAYQCMNALKKMEVSPSDLVHLQGRLEELTEDSSAMAPCLKLVQSLSSKTA